MQSAERDGNVSPEQLQVADCSSGRDPPKLLQLGFLTSPDASDQRPRRGPGVAILGSLYMMLLTAALSLPIGVAASIYLEEFAPKNRLTDFIEVNIANLAAVPSIVFGILGLAIFINFAELPVSSPLVGALVLTLMTLPTIIIATARACAPCRPRSATPPGRGRLEMQTVFHHVLPLAMPGILTGTILGLANALGETAPLLLIGMVAFVENYPSAPPERLRRPRHRAARPGLFLGQPRRPRLRGALGRRHHRAPSLSSRDERHRDPLAPPLRAPLVRSQPMNDMRIFERTGP
jgi:phosphate transport system permease protein